MKSSNTCFQMGRYLKDFSEGMLIDHATSKTIFESDNNIFSLMTMNHHPIHTNVDFAKRSEHGRLLVVGTLVIAIVVGMTVPDISGKAIANLEYEKIVHLSPVFVNDTIYAQTKVISVSRSVTKPDRGVLYVETTAFNQNRIPVLLLRRKVLIPFEELM